MEQPAFDSTYGYWDDSEGIWVPLSPFSSGSSTDQSGMMDFGVSVPQYFTHIEDVGFTNSPSVDGLTNNPFVNTFSANTASSQISHEFQFPSLLQDQWAQPANGGYDGFTAGVAVPNVVDLVPGNSCISQSSTGSPDTTSSAASGS